MEEISHTERVELRKLEGKIPPEAEDAARITHWWTDKSDWTQIRSFVTDSGSFVAYIPATITPSPRIYILK